MDIPLTHSQLVRWRTAIFAVFLVSGLSISTWAARVPAIKDAIGVDRGELGLMLLVGGVASIVGLSVSAPVLTRFGARRAMLGAMTVLAAGVAIIGIGADVARMPLVVVLGLVLWGSGAAALDVMMNVEGAAIEQRSGRTILPLFHAFFSFGAVIGAAIGWLMIQLGVDVVQHLLVTALAIMVIALVSVANVPPDSLERHPREETTQGTRRERFHRSLSAWREPRTYAIGVIILGMAFAEGGANDWLALGVVEGHGADESLGAAGLAIFSVSMTFMRAFGGPLVDRFGRVDTLRVLAILATAGLVLFILAPEIPLVFLGAALWGAGVSLGFPLGMSAAADDPARAATRVSAVATIGYLAFLVGPPLLGRISEQIGLLPALSILVVLTIASGLASPAARPIAGSRVGAGRPATDARPEA